MCFGWSNTFYFGFQDDNTMFFCCKKNVFNESLKSGIYIKK